MSPHRAVGNMTPEECFSGKKPEVGHFRIFGSLTYSHVPSEKRTKLEPIAEKGIFVVYNETSKAFWIYLPSQRKVVVRRDVKFEEEKAFRNLRVRGGRAADTWTLGSYTSSISAAVRITGFRGYRNT